MPGEFVSELFGGIFKFIWRLFAEIVLEFLIKGTGYLVCRIFYKRVDPDSIIVILVGIIFLVLIGSGGFMLFEYIQIQISIDSCVDAGRRFDYESGLCELLESV